jgi:ABC-type multidrug transport system fused ATPase/permease subunit
MSFDPPLGIENLSFRYRSRNDLALKNVNLSVGSS